ncbi:MAG: biotin synthase BioB [Candidatus Dadabacteria bacterium]|nr:MAG: biotin synthase BioB [Candidatus Dadabacteria bacterium]
MSSHTNGVRNDWTIEEVRELYKLPFLELVYQAASVHRKYHNPSEVQVCTLLSIKTGGCPEDCGYCSQSVHHKSAVEIQPLLQPEDVLKAARKAKEAGATRFCMGAAWREVRDGKAFDRVLEMIRGVNNLGLEVCCTLGMVSEDQARKLKEAGLHAYNHNVDTSPEYYGKVVTTRTYQDRLETLKNVRSAGITVCCGGILGLGESEEDRISMLHTLATLEKHPESVPINTLVPIEGTPMQDNQPVSVWEFIRVIAVSRILMPESMVRLAAGRMELSAEAQALAFLAGANSIFAGEKLLTTPNPEFERDMELFSVLGLKGKVPDNAEKSMRAANA